MCNVLARERERDTIVFVMKCLHFLFEGACDINERAYEPNPFLLSSFRLHAKGVVAGVWEMVFAVFVSSNDDDE